MGALQLLCLILSLHIYGTVGLLSLSENKTSDKNGLLSSTVSDKASNVLRDILNQESLVRFSMVQKIQNLVMGAIDNKIDRQAIKKKLSKVTKELRDLETKSQIMEEENVKLKEELEAVYGTVNNNKNMTLEKIKTLNESHIISVERNLGNIKKLDDVIRNESLILRNSDRALTKDIEVLKDQMNEMTMTLQNNSLDIARRFKKTEGMLENFSNSLNENLDNVRKELNESTWILSKAFSRNCWDILRKFPSLKGKDGVYIISIASEEKLVYCDMSTDGGGWTVIQRRQDGSTDFYRNWSDYKQGFGDPSKNYWIGNDAIYELTKNKDQELRVELQSFDGAEAYAQYSTFYVGDEGSKYRLTVSGYSGTAGDSLNYHNGRRFSSKDQDNDDRSSDNCATRDHGAWWYGDCYDSNLNGEYAQSAVSGWKYPTWYYWKNKFEALQKTKMMIRKNI